MKLPSGWRVRSVGDLFEVQLGKMLNEEAKLGDFQAPYLTNFNVQWGRFKLDSLNRMSFSSRDREKFALKRGDLIMCEGGEVGRCAIWKEEVTPCFYQKALHRLRPRNRQIIPEFMLAYMRFISGTKRLSDLTSQSSIAHLTLEKLVDLDVHVPPIQEQRKIADILTTWDEALEKLDALIEAQERRKKALMQQLLTGRRRLKGFTEKWKVVRFGEYLVESRIPGNDGSNASKLTVKLYGRGVVAKQERLLGSENTRYFQRKAGQFIYSKLDFLNGAFGIVPAHLDGYETTLDVPAFDVRPIADAKWLLYFVSREEFYTQQVGAAAGGRKARRVNPCEFLAMKLLAPGLEEQRQIAALLDTADEQITLLRSQRTAIDQQKRGLMQRLLTGRLRVEAVEGRTVRKGGGE